jgi:hypothetical protein
MFLQNILHYLITTYLRRQEMLSPALYGNQRFITLFTTAYEPLVCPEPDESSLHPLILILSNSFQYYPPGIA